MLLWKYVVHAMRWEAYSGGIYLHYYMYHYKKPVHQCARVRGTQHQQCWSAKNRMITSCAFFNIFFFISFSVFVFRLLFLYYDYYYYYYYFCLTFNVRRALNGCGPSSYNIMNAYARYWIVCCAIDTIALQILTASL